MKFSEHFRRRYCERFLNLNKFEFKKYSQVKNNIWELDNKLKKILVFSRELSVKPESDFGLYVNCRYGKYIKFLVNEDNDILLIISGDKIVTCYRFSEYKKNWKKNKPKEKKKIVVKSTILPANPTLEYFLSRKENAEHDFIKILGKQQHKIHEIKWLYGYISHLLSQPVKAKGEKRIDEVAKKYDEILNQLMFVYNKFKIWKK